MYNLTLFSMVSILVIDIKVCEDNTRQNIQITDILINIGNAARCEITESILRRTFHWKLSKILYN